MEGGTRSREAAAPYLPTGFDEAIDAEGNPRGDYGEILAALERLDLDEARERLHRHYEELGIVFGTDAGEDVVHLDVVPRLFTANEWDQIERGLLQRTRALNDFIADVYSEQLIVREGAVPARLIETAEHFEAEMVGVEPLGLRASVIGFDVVRGEDGNLRILEDNCQTPSGIAYAIAERAALDACVPIPPPGERRDVALAIELLHDLICRTAPLYAAAAPNAALITDRSGNAASFDHRELADRLGLPLLTPDDLEVRGGRLYGAVPGERPVELHVIYRRTDQSRLHDEEGRETWLRPLLEPVRKGTLGVITTFGAGVADDKLTHAYSDQLVRYYLGEEPILPAVRTYDLAMAEQREQALERADELVFKPRADYGGRGVVIGREADEAERERAIDAVREMPEDYIAQETVRLSTHPTWRDGALQPRHVDLRAFVIGDAVVPGGITRVALEKGSLLVNSTQGGGAKDTWVMASP